MRNVSKFGGALESLPNLMLALRDDTLSWRRRNDLQGSRAGHGKH